MVGSRFADEIRGSSSANILTGGAGNDLLFGYAGVDRLYGGDGNDLIEASDLFGSAVADYVYGGDGIDAVAYIFSGTGVTVNLETGATGGGAAGDRLNSIENVAGSFHADTITVDGGGVAQGGDGDDVLSGSTVLPGGPLSFPSTEILFGGSGADTFVLHNNKGADIIADFSFVEGDTLRVSSAEFGYRRHRQYREPHRHRGRNRRRPAVHLRYARNEPLLRRGWHRCHPGTRAGRPTGGIRLATVEH